MATKSLFKKQKLGILPGDLPLSAKAEMLEKGSSVVSFGPHVQVMNQKAAKSFKKIVKSKERARLKERFQKEVKDS